MVFERFRRRESKDGGPAEDAVAPGVRDLERQLRDAQKAHEGRVREARKHLEQLERGRERELRAARDEIARREAEHARRIAEAEQRLASVRATLQPLEIARFGKVRLFEDRIETKDGVARLGRGTNAIVDSAARIAISRPGAVARLAASGRVDGRSFRAIQGLDAKKVFLLVDAPDLVSLMPVRWGEEEVAQHFAQRVNIAALNARRLERQREDAIHEVEHELGLVQAFRGAIEAAEADLARLEADTPDIAEAKELLAEAEADTDAVAELRARVEAAREEARVAQLAAAAAAAEVVRAEADVIEEASPPPAGDVTDGWDEASASDDPVDAGMTGSSEAIEHVGVDSDPSQPSVPANDEADPADDGDLPVAERPAAANG
ncbi:MAG: hypothetical protein R3C15_19765 [Thermoleophilia bacterium]